MKYSIIAAMVLLMFGCHDFCNEDDMIQYRFHMANAGELERELNSRFELTGSLEGLSDLKEQIVKQYLLAFQYCQRSSDPYRNIANLYYQFGELSKAKEYAIKGYNIDKETDIAIIVNICLLQGNNKEAELWLDRLIDNLAPVDMSKDSFQKRMVERYYKLKKDLQQNPNGRHKLL